MGNENDENKEIIRTERELWGYRSNSKWEVLFFFDAIHINGIQASFIKCKCDLQKV